MCLQGASRLVKTRSSEWGGLISLLLLMDYTVTNASELKLYCETLTVVLIYFLYGINGLC